MTSRPVSAAAPHRASLPWPLLPAALGLVLALAAGPARAQEPLLSRLGLSASPTEYVQVLETPVGQPFTLYLIATGPAEGGPLAFGLQSVSWAVYSACCAGSPVAVTGVEYNDACAHEGDPYFSVATTAAGGCLAGDTVVLAALTFDWAYPGAWEFPLAAGATSPAYDCDGGEHFLSGLYVQVFGRDGGQTPAGEPSWGGVKALYR